MEIFAQNKRLRIIVILLAVINLAVIGTFVWKDIMRKPREEKSDFKDVSSALKKELGLSDEQAEKIRNLRTEFFEREKVLEGIIRSGRDSLNVVMFSRNTNEEQAKEIARRIADNEYAMELLRFEQAQKFKSICNPEQMEKFEGLVKEIRDYFKPEDKNKDKKNKRDDRKRD